MHLALFVSLLSVPGVSWWADEALGLRGTDLAVEWLELFVLVGGIGRVEMGAFSVLGSVVVQIFVFEPRIGVSCRHA